MANFLKETILTNAVNYTESQLVCNYYNSEG